MNAVPRRNEANVFFLIHRQLEVYTQNIDKTSTAESRVFSFQFQIFSRRATGALGGGEHRAVRADICVHAASPSHFPEIESPALNRLLCRQ